MAQLTTTIISVNGKAVNQFHSFSLSQSICEHHHFRLSCPANALEAATGTVFSETKGLLGKPFTAQINAVGTKGSMKFKGIITNIDAEKFSGSNGDITISGFSATKILDSGPHCKTWEKKAVKNILQDVLKHFPQNLLNPKIAPIYPETLSYYVQYKETAWEFINRICATFGEWLYFDGQSLLAGPPAAGEAIPLIFGNNLSRFSLALNLRPPLMQAVAYDYTNSEVYTSTPQGIEGKAGLKDFSIDAYNSSKELYSSTPKLWNNHFLTNKKQLDDQVNIRAAMLSAQHVRFNGSGEHPGVAVGGRISVEGKNIYSLSNEAFGNYTVISVNHYTDGQGNYNNEFVAIPDSIKVPPVTALPGPVSETQSAMVTDNHDPKGLGRVRVKFHWMNGAEKTPWIRVTSPHGGGGKGMFFIPEVGEEVIVGFEGDSPLKPYIIGTVYHSKANNSYSNAGNDVKALQTRSGNKLVMNDAQGSVHLTDKGGADMMFDGAGNVISNNNNDSTNNVGNNYTSNVGTNHKIIVGKGGEAVLNMDSGGNITLDGKTSLKITVGASVFEMKSDGTITLNGKSFTAGATDGIAMKAANSFKASAANNHIAGITKMDGGDVFIN